MSEEKNIEEIPEEQPVNIVPKDKILSSPEPIADAEQQEYRNQNPQIENMEVHKHPHHVTHKKKWGEYLLEFLMLFLAVFLGFVAENIRENSVERHREKEYIQSFIKNVESDIGNLNIFLERNRLRLSFLDSLVSMSKTDVSLLQNTKMVYYYFLRTRFFPNYYPNDATILQLKNSGNFRLIQKVQVADSILAYDASNKYISERSELIRSMTVRTWEAANPIMDLTIGRDTLFYKDRRLVKQPPPLINNPEKLRSLFNSASEEARGTAAYIGFLYVQSKKAEVLISLMKKEYQIK